MAGRESVCFGTAGAVTAGVCGPEADGPLVCSCCSEASGDLLAAEPLLLFFAMLVLMRRNVATRSVRPMRVAASSVMLMLIPQGKGIMYSGRS